MMTRIVRLASLVLSCVLLTACGGGEAGPTAPKSDGASPAKEPTAPLPAASKTAPVRSNIDLMESKNSPAPTRLPRLQLEGPALEQVIPTPQADSYKIGLKVVNWADLPQGAYVQLVLDNVPFRPVTDPKEKVPLKDLTKDGKAPGEGEHILAAYVALANHEVVKADKAVVVRRFWIGKKGKSTWSWSDDPLLVVARPHGTYEGEAARKIVVDFFVVNAELGDKQYSVRVTLKGPGIKDEGLQRFFTEWKPLVVWEPTDGAYTIEAELLAPKGELAQVPWNPTTRTFSVRGASP